MSSKIMLTGLAVALLAGVAQAEDLPAKVEGKVEATAVVAAASKTETVAATAAPASQGVIDAVKDAPPAIVSGSAVSSPTINVPAEVSASIPSAVSATAPVSGSVPVSSTDTTAGVTTLDEAFAAISDTTAGTQAEAESTLGSGEKLEDYMKDAARPPEETGSDHNGIVPMPPDGDDMMGY